MGVRGLRTYLKCYCPEACYKVHLQDVISKRWCESKCRPEIVVDASSCYSMWCRGLNWTIGLEVQELLHRLQCFVETFDEIGADLVFFVSGLTPQKMRRTWLRHKINSMRNMLDVFDMLYDNKTYEDIPEFLDAIPPNMGNFVTFVLKHVLNCTVYVSVGDCDAEIIHYVHENDCFAIFSCDTDFIVSLVNCVVLDGDSYDCSKQTVFLYDSDALCKYLKIEDDQLPLLAILAGNDSVDCELLKSFHMRICSWFTKHPRIPYKILMESIARYIKGLSRRIRVSKKLMERICQDVFGDYSRVDDMMLAYYSYIPGPTPDFTADDQWTRILKIAKVRLQKVLLPVSAWGVLSEQVYESAVCLEDLRKINNRNEDVRNCPSATLTRRLRRRFYGVLLYEKRNAKPTVDEWCAENTNSYQKPVTVKPEYPKVHHPGLGALWNTNQKNTHHLKKWKLFLGAVSPCINNITEWLSLPDDTVVSAATCYYLYFEKHFLKKWEVEAVLMTVVLFSYYGRFFLNAVNQVKGQYQSLRAIQISVSFSRTYSLVFSLMASCGFPVPFSQNTAYIKFEPVLFQIIYKQAKMHANVGQLCNNNENVLKIFIKMKKAIFR